MSAENTPDAKPPAVDSVTPSDEDGLLIYKFTVPFLVTVEIETWACDEAEARTSLVDSAREAREWLEAADVDMQRFGVGKVKAVRPI